MSDDFEDMMDFVLAWEGRTFEDDPDDPGGATKYGLCLRSLKQRAQTDYAWLTSIGVRLPADKESIRNLTERQAYRMYARYYWDPVDRYGLGRKSRAAMFDTNINCGLKRAVSCMQRYIGTEEDGIAGPVTLEVAKSYQDRELAQGILSNRMQFYERLVRSKPVMKKYLRGWRNRVNALADFLGKF